MGIVIDMPPRGRPKGEIRAVLQEAIEQTDNGELHGAILIRDTDEGTRFNALGACRDRLQIGILTTIRGSSIWLNRSRPAGRRGVRPPLARLN
jgi:hypothetical protein